MKGMQVRILEGAPCSPSFYGSLGTIMDYSEDGSHVEVYTRDELICLPIDQITPVEETSHADTTRTTTDQEV